MVINESSTRVPPFVFQCLSPYRHRSIQNDFSLVYHLKMIFHKVFKNEETSYMKYSKTRYCSCHAVSIHLKQSREASNSRSFKNLGMVA